MKQHPIYKHITLSECGTRIYSTFSNKYLTIFEKDDGYLICHITISSKKYKTCRVNRLIAETYHGWRGLDWDAHHKDHDKSNNHKDNIMWETRSGNILAALEVGANPMRGETHLDSIYTEDKIHILCKMLEDGYRNCDIRSELGVSKDTIAHIKGGRAWKHISKDYKINVVRKERISQEKIKQICELLERRVSMSDIVRQIGVKRHTVERIKYKQIYHLIVSQYSF